MGAIYKITNKINNKVYIGQTKKTLKEKQLTHLSDFKKYCAQSKNNNRPLYDAFKQYGIENFNYEILLICDDNELNIQEQRFIKLYHSYVGDDECNGYNATIGGAGRPYELSSKELEQLIILFHQGHNISSIASILNYDVTIISRKLHELGFDCKKGKRKPVYQINKKTNQILNWFESCSDAAIKLFGNQRHNAHINDAASGKRKTAYGYKWCFVEDYKK